MNPYLKSIKVIKVRGLADFTIGLSDTTRPADAPVHLMLTGRNGVGKTSLLMEVFEALSYPIKKDAVELDWESDVMHGREGCPIIALYTAHRKPEFQQPTAPRQMHFAPVGGVRESRSREFINFLLNLKVQRSLSRDEGNEELVSKIDAWFAQFTEVLGRVFNDPELKLEFAPRNYHFSIVSKGQVSPLTNLADGYAALLDIVADLILKMQRDDSIVAAFDYPGIVLIDEVETHLHLELQRMVMPVLTSIFPKIQFITTTHSPFVLSSIGNAVVYDLERKVALDNADDYPYDSLAEGFFGVSGQSGYISSRYEKFRKLAELPTRTPKQESELLALLKEFQQVPQLVNPALKAAVQQLSITHGL